MDGEDWGMGCSSTESREEGSRGGGGWSLVEGYKGGKKKKKKEGEGRTERGEGQVVMNVLLFTAHCLLNGCGSRDSGSFVRKTDRMASVTSHVERGEENTHSLTHRASNRRRERKKNPANMF